MHGRAAILLLPLCAAATAQLPRQPAVVRVGVLSLFHPRIMELAQGTQHLQVRWLAASRLQVTSTAAGREQPSLQLPAGDVTVHVTGQRTDLRRSYHGTLTVTAGDHELRAVIAMDTELAVASVVAAESPSSTAPQALEAQAIAARSFLLSNLHPGAPFDTCDTTRCQLLQEPPSRESAASRATRATAHQVLVWQPDPWSRPQLVAARWTPSCAGRTRAGHPADSSEYPFYPVACEACQRRPDRWRLPPGTPIPLTEAARERWNRTHPESQVPSLALSAGGSTGQGRGHGLGLCQRGAAAMATSGVGTREILLHYYPNTVIATLP